MGLVVFGEEHLNHYKKEPAPPSKSVLSKLSTRAIDTVAGCKRKNIKLSHSNRIFLESLGYNVISSSV